VLVGEGLKKLRSVLLEVKRVPLRSL
jgi:hypothetical protein